MPTDVEPVALIALTGEIDMDNQGELEQAVLERLTTSSVVLDCSGLDFLSISALRTLDVCAAAAEVAGRHFVLERPARHVSRLLTAAGLDHLQHCVTAR